MIHIEETALGTVVVLTGFVVVGGEMHLTDFEVMDGILTLIVERADGKLSRYRTLFLH